MDWESVIAAASTLMAAGMGAVLGAWASTRRTDGSDVRRQQISTLVDVLEQADHNLAAVENIYLGRSDRYLEWAPWMSVVRRSTVFLDTELAQAVIRLDRETFILFRGTKFIREPISAQALRDLEQEWVNARDALLGEARRAFGHRHPVDASSGMPSRNDPIWSEDYWIRRLGITDTALPPLMSDPAIDAERRGDPLS